MVVSPFGKFILLSVYLLSTFLVNIVVDTPIRDCLFSKQYIKFFSLMILITLTIISFRLTINEPGKVGPDALVKSGNYYCKYCNHIIPMRASHCYECNRCILRRDHHCQIIGICIGQRNHLAYFIFLVLSFIVQSIFSYSTFFPAIRQKDLQYFLWINLPCGILCGISTAHALYVGVIIPEQLYNILTNSTVWEARRRESITYLQDWPYMVSPFSKGIVGNIKEFVTMNDAEINYEIPANMKEYRNRNSFIFKIGDFGTLIRKIIKN